jgi:hypothetical protein
MINGYGILMMWKELVMTYFKVTPQRLPGGTEENDEKLSQASLSLG